MVVRRGRQERKKILSSIIALLPNLWRPFPCPPQTHCLSRIERPEQHRHPQQLQTRRKREFSFSQLTALDAGLARRSTWTSGRSDS